MKEHLTINVDTSELRGELKRFKRLIDAQFVQIMAKEHELIEANMIIGELAEKYLKLVHDIAGNGGEIEVGGLNKLVETLLDDVQKELGI